MKIINKFIKYFSSKLPFRGIPRALNTLGPILFNKPVFEELTVGNVRYDMDISNSLMRNIYFGVFEKHILGLIGKSLKPGSIFVDVGANIGYISAVALNMVGPGGSVHSFEPVPEYFSIMDKAIKISGAANIFLNQTAVGERNGQIEIAVSGKQNIGWNTVVNGFMANIERKYSVPQTTLDDYFMRNGINKVDCVKIDVEGAEGYVLRGMKNTIARGLCPVILCETCPSACKHTGVSIAEIYELMESNGYSSFAINNSGIYRFYTGSIRLKPLFSKDIKSTMDIVWIKKERINQYI